MTTDLNVKPRERLSVVVAFVLLVALTAAWCWPPLLGVGALAGLLLAALNVPLLRFFQRKRGLAFAVVVIPVYWVFLLICGLGFSLGLARHLLRRHP